MNNLQGFYHEYGYEIADSHNEIIYSAGNHLNCSYSITSLDKSLPLSTLKDFCNYTGQELAKERGVKFLGSEYVDNK